MRWSGLSSKCHLAEDIVGLQIAVWLYRPSLQSPKLGQARDGLQRQASPDLRWALLFRSDFGFKGRKSELLPAARGGEGTFGDLTVNEEVAPISGPSRVGAAALIRRIASRRARTSQLAVESQSRIRDQLSRMFLTIAINPKLHSSPVKVPYFAAVPTINSEKVTLYPSFVLKIIRDGLRGRRSTGEECTVLIVCLDVLSARFATGASYNFTLLNCGGEYCKCTDRD
jgi:hypothetical protein